MTMQRYARYAGNFAESLLLAGLYPWAWKGDGSSGLKAKLRYRYAMAEFEGMSPMVRRFVRSRIPQNKYISVLEFPKCGRTYLRFMIARVIAETYGIPFRYALFDPAIPELGLPAFRYIHGFDEEGDYRDGYLTVGKTALLNSVGLVLLYRDPLRVMISYYHHCKDRTGRHHGTFKDFIRDESLGLLRYASYVAHFKKEVSANSGLVLTYEDMVANPAASLRTVLGFARLPYDEKAIEIAVSKSGFDAMKKYVAETPKLPSWLLPTSKDVNSQKVRDGGRTPLGAYYERDDVDFIELTWKSFGHGEYAERFEAARKELDA